MRLNTKIFFAIFGVSTFLSFLAIFISYRATTSSLTEQYEARYTTWVDTVGETMRRMEATSDIIASNALIYIKELDRQQGVLSTKRLAELAHELNVSHFYVTDASGKFIRTTDTPIEVVQQGLFSFCEGYRGLITGAKQVERTPILPSYPYKGPYKFTMIPNHNRTRILEAGIHLSFLSRLLREAIQSDTNVVSLGFYTPTGHRLGSIDSKGQFQEGDSVDVSFLGQPGLALNNNRLVITKTLEASQRECCECKTKGVATAGNGYFYYLKAEVSLGTLATYIAQIQNRLILLFLACLIIGFFLSRWLASLLINKLHKIERWVGDVILTDDLTRKSGVTGNDEVSAIASQFERMMGHLATSRNQLVELEKSKSLAELASHVAHDIRSPLCALSVIAEDVSELPETHRKLLQQTVARISDIANNLLDRYRNPVAISDPAQDVVQLIPPLVEALLAEKRTQYRDRLGVIIETKIENEAFGLFSKVNAQDFTRVLSNLINNAVEAIASTGFVRIRLGQDSPFVRIVVEDNGRGIPAEKIEAVLLKGVSLNKASGTGIGLSQAKELCEKWGGQLRLASVEGKGTTVTLLLPRANPPSWFVDSLNVDYGDDIIVVDDDPSIHSVWESRLSALRSLGFMGKMIHFTSLNELERWYLNRPNPMLLNFLLLSDFHFEGERRNGLEVISANRLSRCAILVTSHSEDASIQTACNELGVKLLPKSMASTVPLKITGRSSNEMIQRMSAVDQVAGSMSAPT